METISVKSHAWLAYGQLEQRVNGVVALRKAFKYPHFMTRMMADMAWSAHTFKGFGARHHQAMIHEALQPMGALDDHAKSQWISWLNSPEWSALATAMHFHHPTGSHADKAAMARAIIKHHEAITQCVQTIPLSEQVSYVLKHSDISKDQLLCSRFFSIRQWIESGETSWLALYVNGYYAPKTLSAAFSQVCDDEQCLKDTITAMMKDESHSLSIRIRAVCALLGQESEAVFRLLSDDLCDAKALFEAGFSLDDMKRFGHASDKLLKQGMSKQSPPVYHAPKSHKNIEMMTFFGHDFPDRVTPKNIQSLRAKVVMPTEGQVGQYAKNMVNTIGELVCFMDVLSVQVLSGLTDAHTFIGLAGADRHGSFSWDKLVQETPDYAEVLCTKEKKVQSLLSFQIKQAQKQAKGSVREARLKKKRQASILRVDKHKDLMKRSVTAAVYRCVQQDKMRSLVLDRGEYNAQKELANFNVIAATLDRHQGGKHALPWQSVFKYLDQRDQVLLSKVKLTQSQYKLMNHEAKVLASAASQPSRHLWEGAQLDDAEILAVQAIESTMMASYFGLFFSAIPLSVPKSWQGSLSKMAPWLRTTITRLWVQSLMIVSIIVAAMPFFVLLGKTAYRRCYPDLPMLQQQAHGFCDEHRVALKDSMRPVNELNTMPASDSVQKEASGLVVG